MTTNHTDLIRKLRSACIDYEMGTRLSELIDEAADALEAMQAEPTTDEAYVTELKRVWRDMPSAAPTLSDERCQPNGLMFDALGAPRTRYVRVTLDGNHCVMRPSEGDTYLSDARDAGDESAYVVADVWLSEREFDDLPEHEGF